MSLKKLLSVALSVSVLTVPALTLNSSAGCRRQNTSRNVVNNATRRSDLEDFARLLNQLEAETKADKKSASEKSKSSTAKKVLTTAGTVIALGAAGFGAAVLHAKYGKGLDWADAVKNNVVTDRASVAMNWIKDGLGLIDHGCAVNEKWDRETETCVPKTCKTSKHCGEGYACVSNKCKKFEEWQSCSSTSDCAEGEVCFNERCETSTCLNDGKTCEPGYKCSERTGICELNTDEYGCRPSEKYNSETLQCESKCPSHQTYNMTTNKCDSIKCSKKKDCPGTSVCGSSNVCEEATCLNKDFDCNDEQLCTSFGTCMNKPIKDRLVKANWKGKYICPKDYVKYGDGLLKLDDDVYCVDCSKAGGVLGKDGWCVKNQ